MSDNDADRISSLDCRLPLIYNAAKEQSPSLESTSNLLLRAIVPAPLPLDSTLSLY